MSAENKAILEKVIKLVGEGEKLADNGSLKAAQRVFKEAYSRVMATMKLHIVGAPYAHAEVLKGLGRAQADAGDFRGTQKSFKLARSAALDATRAVTSGREREQFADDIAIEEALLFLKLGGVEAAPDIAKLLKHPRLSHAASVAILAYRDRGLISFEQVEMLKRGFSPEEVVPAR